MKRHQYYFQSLFAWHTSTNQFNFIMYLDQSICTSPTYSSQLYSSPFSQSTSLSLSHSHSLSPSFSFSPSLDLFLSLSHFFLSLFHYVFLYFSLSPKHIIKLHEIMTEVGNSIYRLPHGGFHPVELVQWEERVVMSARRGEVNYC